MQVKGAKVRRWISGYRRARTRTAVDVVIDALRSVDMLRPNLGRVERCNRRKDSCVTRQGVRIHGVMRSEICVEI